VQGQKTEGASGREVLNPAQGGWPGEQRVILRRLHSQLVSRPAAGNPSKEGRREGKRPSILKATEKGGEGSGEAFKKKWIPMRTAPSG